MVLDPRKRFAAAEVLRTDLSERDARRLVELWNADAEEGDGWRMTYAARQCRDASWNVGRRKVRV